MLCPSCGSELIPGANFCPMCGAPAAAATKTKSTTGPSWSYDSYGTHDAASAGPTPVASGDTSYSYNPGGTGNTGTYGTTGTVNYDASEWPGASPRKQRRVLGPYSTSSEGFPMPMGMLVWSIIMIFMSGALGIISTVFCVLARLEKTREGYDRKIRIARVVNIVATMVFVIMFLVAGVGGCAALILSEDSDFMNSIDGIVQEYEGDSDSSGGGDSDSDSGGDALAELLEQLGSNSD